MNRVIGLEIYWYVQETSKYNSLLWLEYIVWLEKPVQVWGTANIWERELLGSEGQEKL